MSYEITEKYQDIAEKWRIRVDIGNLETIFVKFDYDPTDEEVWEEADRVLAIRETERIAQEAEMQKQQIVKEVMELLYPDEN